MKKLFTLFALVITLITSAQAPQGFNYQATVRNSSGALIANQNVYFKFNVMLNSATSVPVYSETHYVPTDDLGQVNCIVGKGTASTGTFSSINWGAGSYYLGIELKTGADYVAMGTTQLLSVPYALYANSAGSTQSQGKTSIYLTGNITDAQAATKIAAELGPFTENIYIRNTTQLINVDLSALVTIGNIEIENNSNLSNVNLNNLTTIEDTFQSSDNYKLNAFSFPSLLNCSSFSMYGSNISSLSFPSLTYIDEFNLSPYDAGNYTHISTITSLNFPSVQVISGHFRLNELKSLASLTFPMLHTLSGDIFLSSFQGMGGGGFSNLATISFPALTSCTGISNSNMNISRGSGSIYIEGLKADASINLSSLTSCNTINLGFLANLNLSSLTSCSTLGVYGFTNFTPPTNLVNCGVLSISSMDNISALSFPSLASCSQINIVNNPLLTSVSFPALTNCDNLSLGTNALPTTKINSLLHQMLTVAPVTGKSISLNSQNPLAPPTGQGITDKQKLINAGNAVTTD